MNTTFSEMVEAYQDWKMEWGNSPADFERYRYLEDLEAEVIDALSGGQTIENYLSIYHRLHKYVYGVDDQIIGEIEE